ncbi:MAG: SDR family oxidoreductase [Bryobacteraceae bacterium]|nr:SDR family oxidoreductase [Bryobacteraceae bacterium]
MRFHELQAVVTGGASGIGAATVALLRAEGARVLVLDRTAETACDVTDEDAVAHALSALHRIDVLVTCAGAALRKSVHEQDGAGWDHVFAVNVKGAFLAAKHALPKMPAGAAIVHVASVVAVTGFRQRAAYTASKGAMVALTRNMALDYAGQGIRVNCVCPGFVRTPFIQPILDDEARAARLAALHPLGRLGTPEDVAKSIAFLTSADAAWITGHALSVDGGLAAGHAMEI